MVCVEAEIVNIDLAFSDFTQNEAVCQECWHRPIHNNRHAHIHTGINCTYKVKCFHGI